MRPGHRDIFELGELAAIMEIDPAFLEQCVRHGAIRLEALPEDSDGVSPSQLARLRRLRRICRSLDIDVFAGCIIVDLLERMEGLQRELDDVAARRRETQESSSQGE